MNQIIRTHHHSLVRQFALFFFILFFFLFFCRRGSGRGGCLDLGALWCGCGCCCAAAERGENPFARTAVPFATFLFLEEDRERRESPRSSSSSSSRRLRQMASRKPSVSRTTAAPPARSVGMPTEAGGEDNETRC